MKCSILRQQGLRCLLAVFLTMFMLWGSSPAFAAGNEPILSVTPYCFARRFALGSKNETASLTRAPQTGSANEIFDHHSCV